jgi:hypothetical protein
MEITEVKDRWGHTATYRCWRSMMQRCYRVKDTNYSHYGGSGIRVSERWHKFVNFLTDMGKKPQGMSIDRIDNAKCYSPGNCRWANAKTQARNRSIVKKVEFRGEKLTIPEWAERTGLPYRTLRHRIGELKWSPEKALTTPVMSRSQISRLANIIRWKHG